MLLSELVEELDSDTISVLQDNIAAQEFNGTAMLGSTTTEALNEPGVIYFASATLFNRLPEELCRDRAFFLLADTPLKPVPSPSYVALIKSSQDWIFVLEHFASQFRQIERCKVEILKLTELVNRGATLEHVVNDAARIIGAPASVMDNAMGFLAVSKNFPFFVAHGQENASKTLPDDAWPLLKTKGLINPKKPFDLFIFDWTDDDGQVFTNHFALIHSQDTIVGSISFFTKGGHLKKSRMDMMPAIAQILSIQMQRSDSFLLNKTLYYAHLFQQMQEGTLARDAEQIKANFSLFGYRLRPYMHLLFIDVSQEFLPLEQLQLLAQRVHAHIPNSIYTVNQTGVTFLASDDEPREEALCDKAALAQVLKGTSARIGMSEVFIDPHTTPMHLAQAKRALTAAARLNSTEKVTTYAHWRMYDLLLNVEDGDVLELSCFPPVMRLLDHDEHEGTSLMHTLYEHLRRPNKPAEVAALLFIHKNTLYYRLERIREIMDCDLHDAQTVANIQITFCILRMQHRLPFDMS